MFSVFGLVAERKVANMLWQQILVDTYKITPFSAKCY